MLVLRSALTFFLGVGLLATCLRGEEAEPGFAGKLAPVPPCAALTAATRARQIPLERIDRSGQAGRLDAGDSVTALVTLCEKHARRTQWLLYLEAVPPEPKDLSPNPAKPMVLYSGCGHRLEFASSPIPVTLRTIGPFPASPGSRGPLQVQDQRERFSVDKGLLGLGLDRAAAALCRFKDTNAGALFWFSPNPPTPAELRKYQRATESLPISAEEERALGGLAPALISYLGIVEHTKGLDEILMEVVDKPSVWSFMWHLGVTATLSLQQEQIRAADITAWGLPDHPPAYLLPMRLYLNDHRALDVTFVVTVPRPPLLECGGIIGLLAEKPSDKETYLTLRVISARRQMSAPERSNSQSGVPLTLPCTSPVNRLGQKTQKLGDEASPKPPWGRIVLVGASASAGFTESEPFGGPNSRRYRLSRYVDAAVAAPHEAVRNFANSMFFLQPEAEGRRQIDEALRSNPTLVVALDFLFWFCYGDGATDAARLKRFEQGLKLLEGISCSVIVGDIPDASAAIDTALSPEQVPSAPAIAAANRRLKQWAATHKRVVVLPLSKFMRAALANQVLTVHGRTFAAGQTLSLLQPDKLHPSQQGCAVLAVSLLDAFAATQPALPAADVRWDADEVLRLGSPVPSGKRPGQTAPAGPPPMTPPPSQPRLSVPN